MKQSLNKRLTGACGELFKFINKNTQLFELSFGTVMDYLKINHDKIMNSPLTAEQMANGQRFLRLSEERRQEKLKEYASEKGQIP